MYSQKIIVILYIIAICITLSCGCFEQCEKNDSVKVTLIKLDKESKVTVKHYTVYLSVNNTLNAPVENIWINILVKSPSSWDETFKKTIEIDELQPFESQIYTFDFDLVSNDLEKDDFEITVYQRNGLCRVPD